MRKQAALVGADEWLDGLMHQSPAFQARVEEELAAINVAQDLVALRESRGLSQRRLAEQLGVTQSAIAQLDVSIRPRRQNERKSRQRRGSSQREHRPTAPYDSSRDYDDSVTTE
jgi:ribosome-binding protein aMBF1 (putative translation factor)